jgi:hypothetical protein
MALNSIVEFSIDTTLTGSADFGAPSSRISYQKRVELLTGTAAAQADMVWSDQRTVAQAANEDLDFAGALTNVFGVSQTFVKIKAVAIYSAAANTLNLTVSRPATTGINGMFDTDGDSIKVYPGGWFFWFAGTGNNGATVIATTDDVLNIAASAVSGSAVYDIIVIGTSA